MITVYLYEKTGENAEKNTGDFITMSLDAHFGKGTEEKVAKTPLGKPYLENGRAYIGVTHTGELVLIGISDENFGIDAESLSESPKNLERIVKRFFSEGEKAYFYGSVKGSVERKRRFLEVWVKKEAYVKWLGTGFKDLAKADTAESTGFFGKIDVPGYEAYIFSEKQTAAKVIGKRTGN